MKDSVRLHAKAVHDYIQVHGWCQHKWRDKDGSVCLRGAMDIICVKEHPTLGKMVDGYSDLCEEIYQVTGCYPIEYNDAPERTKEDVLSLMGFIAGIY